MTTPLTDEAIKRLRELHEKATPGPWEADDISRVRIDGGGREVHVLSDEWTAGPARCTSKDADLICEAVNALPSLLAEVERLRDRDAEIAELKADLAEMHALDAEAQIGADEQTKQLAALHSRCAALEAVREAAEDVSRKYDPCCDNPRWDKLSEALDKAALAEAAEGSKDDMKWEPFETAPKDGRNILVFCPKNELGKHRTLMAFYAQRFEIESEEGGELNKADDCFYAPEGWYEFCWLDDDAPLQPIPWKITHWMPLPEAPKEPR